MRTFQHCSERTFEILPAQSRQPGRSQLIESSCRCWCLNSGNTKSEASTSANPTIASEEGAIASGRGSSVLKDSVQIAANAKVQTGGQTTGTVGAGAKVGTSDINVTDAVVAGGDVLTTNLDLSAARIGDANTTDNSLDLGGSRIGSTEIGSIQITDTSADLLSQALDRVASFAAETDVSRNAALQGVLSLANLNAQTTADNTAASSDKLTTLLDALTTSKTADQPDAGQNKTILYLVGAVLLYLIFKK